MYKMFEPEVDWRGHNKMSEAELAGEGPSLEQHAEVMTGKLRINGEHSTIMVSARK